MHRVFAYGSNMDLADLQRWSERRGQDFGRLDAPRVACLTDHALVWNYRSESRGGGAANIAPAAGSRVYGLLIGVCETSLVAFDSKEGHPHRYRRVARRVRAAEDELEAWVYVVLPEFCRRDPVWPTRAYRQLLTAAAERHRFPEWYRAALAAVATCD